MGERLVPVFRVADGHAAAAFYERLGFDVVGEHRFTPELPRYVFLSRHGVELHLSEHVGDAPEQSLAYGYVDDLDAVAAALDLDIASQPWGRELEVVDPDGNRLRLGETGPSR